MKQILVIDDDISIRQLFDRLGTHHQWEVTSLPPWQVDDAVLRDGRFGLAFLDVDLGRGPNGIALALKLREASSGIHVVMMSGDTGNAERVSAAGLGQMLQKPFELTSIEALVTLQQAKTSR